MSKKSEMWVIGLLAAIGLGFLVYDTCIKSDGVISYEVLKKTEKRGDIILDVLVSEDASKEEVMKLGEKLRKKYSDKLGKLGVICIYDTREAQRRRTDDSYPETELSKHWLVVISGLESDPVKQVRWVAEGRGH
jgi:hypothetical protein